MKLFPILLLMAVLASSTICAGAQAPLERGVKGDVEDVILVAADDWHASIAATPLAIWSEENRTVTKPLLILPKEVSAGERNGWVDQTDLEKYGASAILDTLRAANITAIIIHGKGEAVKSLVEAAHKDGMKAYVTASLELPKVAGPGAVEIMALPEAKDVLLEEAGLAGPGLDDSRIDKSWLQVANPEVGGNASYFCPVNPEVRDYLYNQIEMLIDDYRVDGVVLYQFGFQDENYCFCNVCKENFYKDTGVDITKVHANSYNLERWNQWKQEQILQMVKEARNITVDMGPVKLGVALDSPFDRSRGYDYAEISRVADFSLISPLSAQDVRLASGISERPVYVRLSDDYVGYVLSTQNVEGTVKYIEDLCRAGAKGVAFEYNVVYTPLWSELEPPSPAARWLLGQIGGRSLGIGNVSWKCNARLAASSSSEMAAKLSNRWKSSPGAVLVGENYSAALLAAPLASYLNWPILFADRELPAPTAAALKRLKVKEVAVAGFVSEKVRQNLSGMNLTILDVNSESLIREMKARGESPEMVVMTNSHDLSLLPPAPVSDVQRTLIKDLLVRTEIVSSQVPAEEVGEIVRLNVTMTNSNSEELRRFVNGRSGAVPQVVELFLQAFNAGLPASQHLGRLG